MVLESFAGKFYQIKPVLCKFFQQQQQKGDDASKLIHKASIILIPKPDKNTTKQKQNYRPVSLMNEYKCQILSKILNWIEWQMKRIKQGD